jgi:ADP-ribose pyrophosphatase YjhB (NUDIX family)
VFDRENKVALIGTKVNPFYLLPGGGIYSNESIEEGVVRECLEEIGCKVILENKVGIIEDYRNRDKTHCISYCFTARLVGEKGQLNLTLEEENNGMHVMWVSFDEALEILEKEALQLKKGKVSFYNTGFNILRDLEFIQKVKADCE